MSGEWRQRTCRGEWCGVALAGCSLSVGPSCNSPSRELRLDEAVGLSDKGRLWACLMALGVGPVPQNACFL